MGSTQWGYRKPAPFASLCDSHLGRQQERISAGAHAPFHTFAFQKRCGRVQTDPTGRLVKSLTKSAN
ncbi:hypothetical protein T4B_3728 [Trichinella pseudospiralis]|uniref:Uncharacterized protein n=2 Tax=Trichinella pseudospiralis TaxID=6337 RepID=A0A0V1EHR5_TRIPS|nr:hypothetical protein T4E_6575 [Trichinella pseudospiralis]KRY73364.1 hypothetical protein T4A_9754 [Trichinella pseudospiralis]KRY90655.1 hypothetical protein T4D_5659 [Trichinella pseudospiralis]KRZ18566.1 hypothetical protein T4B_3728 [Trichinella pseudospiralis]KRZ38877.1 hypothetical protein T4C_9648 [Trichinella pseudospiralis]